jgi:hypothetical protein
MMNFKKTVVLTITSITFIVSNSLNAQVKNSLYSMFGVGQLSDDNYGINKSLGGTGIAFQSGRSINYSNPASYLGIFPNSFNIELGLYGIYSRSENNIITQTDGDVKFHYFSASMYLKNWWASCFGIVPFSFIDYEIHSIDAIGGELTSFGKNFKGTGGLRRIYLGNSLRIYKGLAVGFNASYLFGIIKQTETANSNESFTGYEIKNECTAQSYYLDYGMQYSIRKDAWLYTAGLIYGASKRMNSNNDLEFTYNGLTSPLKPDKRPGIKIPQKIGLGISINNGNNFRAGFDYKWENWSKITNSNANFDTKNSKRFSIGMEYSPSPRDSWFKVFIYRLGANYKNSYLQINNTPINSLGITFGVGIPFYGADICNLSVEYGEEGTLNKRLIKSSYWLFCLSLSAHQKIITRNK